MRHAPFVHLNVHTQYSLLNATCKLKTLVNKAVEHNFPAIAITDQGNLFGSVEFYKTCKKAGIKPIVGMHTYVAPQSRFDKAAHGIREASFHLTLLVKNAQGYRNLSKLSSIGYLEGFYYKPRVDKEVMEKYSEGLIALFPALNSEVAHYALADQPEETERVIQDYLKIFGKDHLYFEVQNHGIDREKKAHDIVRELSEKYGIGRVATNSVYYLERRDSYAHEALTCIGTNSILDDPGRFRLAGDSYYLKSEKEMREAIPDDEEAFTNSLKIADQCCLELELGKNHLPIFTPPDGKTDVTYLKELCDEGLKKKMNVEKLSPEYIRRLAYELGVINKMQYTSYYLIAMHNEPPKVHRAHPEPSWVF